MANNIIEASQLPESEKVYLKKDWLGWRVVEPWKCPETGKIDWFVLLTGGKKALFITLAIFGIAIILYLGFLDAINSYQTIANNPCLFCPQVTTRVTTNLLNVTIAS